MTRACDLCHCAVHDISGHGDPECSNCGARQGETYTELRDVIVRARMVGNDIDDNRDPAFDTEKEVEVHQKTPKEGSGLDTGPYTYINDNEVRRPKRTFTFRGQDEIGFFGMFVHGEIHNTMIAEVDKVRVGAETYDHNDDIGPVRSVEMQNGGEFTNLKDRRY